MSNGILLLDKPQGLSSNAALQRVRWALGRVKGGHTGSLDPLATGMLPICLGEATKVAGFLLDGDKRYRFTMRLGQRTATGDLEGEVVEQGEVPVDVGAALSAVLPQFIGAIEQVPPMYSALKQGGERLYRLARQGIEVERPPRRVDIRALTLEAVEGSEATFEVCCSKGTYVRTLAEDLAKAVGSCAHLTMLRRVSVAPFGEAPMVTLEQVQANPAAVPLLPPDAALPHLAAATLSEVSAARFLHGQAVVAILDAQPDVEGALMRVYDTAGCFLGIARTQIDHSLQPVRIFNR
ncbi:MAG: tRNA pseudouridine(55) synthase TruB [Nevskiaceae bacterium]|jgi:tRNA pseudouridine55 synthase|nr:tRNA pseudouridine(55) synthase TruB [Nevskiaceae bacterium]